MGYVLTTFNRQNAELHREEPVEAGHCTIPTKTPVLEDDKYQIEVLSSVQDMARFEQRWRELEDRVANPSNIFQSFDWCMSWAQTCTLDNDCYKIHIITISRDDQCLLIWPMMTTCSGPFHILKWFSEPYSQYGDVLAAKTDNLDEILHLAWKQLQIHDFADSIRLRHVRKDSIVSNFLETNARKDGQINYAPFLEIEKYPTEEAYETRYTKSQRRRRKRIRKNLEKIGPVTFDTNTQGQGFLKTLGLAIKEKRCWLSQRGLYSKPIMSHELEEFFVHLSNNSSTLKTVATQLNAGDQDASYEIGLRFKGHHFGYITAHDARLTDMSPGRLHMDLSQRAAINDGLEAFDLMVPADPHKKTWSSNSVQTRDYFTHLNARGAIYSLAYLKIIRPCVRWLYLKAPTSIRRHITRFVS